MSRARAAVFFAAGVAVAGLGSVGDHGQATAESAAPTTTISAAPPSDPPPSTVGAGITTVPASGVPTTAPAPTIAPRGGAASGSVAKPAQEQVNVRQMLIVTILGIVALAASGFVYGRVRSTPPRHPDLVRTTE